jgi:flagellar biosynthesis protein FliQ
MCVYAVSFRKGLIYVALALAIPSIAEHAIVFRPRLVPVTVLNVVLSFAFDVFTIVVIFRRVFVREKPEAETIFGAVCIYLLIGFSFARLYAILAILQPHAFYLDPAINLHPVPVGFDFIFFSFGSMTTAGAAGISAASAQVRSISMIESVLAVLYIAVMIARLMGAYRPNPHGSQESS